MDTKDIKFGNRYNLYLEVGFLKTLQDWRIKEPDLSFLRLFKENITNANLWPSDTTSREFVLQYTLVHMQTMFSMQSINYIFEIIKDSGLDQSSKQLKDGLKKIKTTIDEDGIEKTTNALQLVKIIREAFAHNSDSLETSNWVINENFEVVIQSKINSSTRHNLKLQSSDLFEIVKLYVNNLQNIQNSITDIYVSGKKLEQLVEQHKILPIHIKSCVKLINNETQDKFNADEKQLNAIYHCLRNDFFTSAVKTKYGSPYRPNFIYRIFPFKFNCHNLLLDLHLATECLSNLPKNFRSYVGLFKPLFETHKEQPIDDLNSVPYLLYFFNSGKMDSIILSNILFSMFSFESMDELTKQFNSEGIDINRIRNSVMHGRFYYNYNKGFDFYDGRNNKELEFIGTLSIKKITEVAQFLMHDYLNDLRADLAT